MTVPVRRIGYWREPNYYARYRRYQLSPAYQLHVGMQRLWESVQTAIYEANERMTAAVLGPHWRQLFRQLQRRTTLRASDVHRRLP